MQDSWQAFLQEQGATIESDGNIEFNTAHLNIPESPICAFLSDFTILAVSGEDRHVFLHGQFINDLNQIESPAAQISAWCNPKGQVITIFLIINTGTSYLLIFKTDLKEYVQKRLNMFIMRSDVTINDISESSPLIGLTNNIELSTLNTSLENTAGAVATVDELIIVCHPDQSGRYLMTGNTEALIKNLPTLNSTMTSSHVWNTLDILSGLPWITTTTQEQFLPQMLNLDALEGLSYQKGCYPGQEVIARLHYRGEVKKRTHLISSEVSLSVGDSLYLKDAQNKAGTIINTALHSDGKTYALAVIDLDKIKDNLFSDEESTQEVAMLELPYAIGA